MKYSLRSLMIAVTLAALLLGGRVEYQRRRALWHEREAARCLKNIQDNLNLSSKQAIELAEHATNEYPLLLAFSNRPLVPGRATEDTCGFLLHKRLAKGYRSAWPWTFVSESPVPGGETGISCEVP